MFLNRCFLIISIILLIIFSCEGCSTDSSKLQQNPIPLEGISVNHLTKFEGMIYAATESGLYKQLPTELLWSPLGLKEKQVINVVFLPNNNMLSAVRISDFSEGIPSLFLSKNKGQNWKPYMQNYGSTTGQFTWVESITGSSKSSDTLFARGSGSMIARSVNAGLKWEIVNGDWDLFGGAAVLIKSDPYYSTRIWAGGVNAFSKPYLLKSIDKGENWEELNVLENIEAVCRDVAVYPLHENIILAAFSGTINSAQIIRKSNDGGITWRTVMENIGAYTFTHSARDPETIYASGQNPAGSLFFVQSDDFGDSWQQVTVPGAPSGIRANDMISVMTDGREVLYFATNKGVYKYSFEK